MKALVWAVVVVALSGCSKTPETPESTRPFWSSSHSIWCHVTDKLQEAADEAVALGLETQDAILDAYFTVVGSGKRSWDRAECWRVAE